MLKFKKRNLYFIIISFDFVTKNLKINNYKIDNYTKHQACSN